jgi:hypothetical protein
MDTEINLADILILKDGLISGIGCVMSSTVVERASSRETDSRLESVGLDQVAGTILDHVANLNHGHSRLDVAPGVLTDLTMDLGCATDIVILIKEKSLCCTLLFVCCPPQVPS